ncbi:MAG: Sjogren's syndrome/scleroderma autoantigen 1 family protein [Candidatus Bathyarchaeia archaeon]
MPEDTKPIQTMVDLLRQGATLTERSCPACSSPLFKLRNGELWCAKCQKRVIVVKEGTTPTEATGPVVLEALESTVLTKIQDIEKKIKGETDPQQLERLSSLLSKLLENLEKLRKMKRT